MRTMYAAQSASPTTSVRSPFFKGSGLTGVGLAGTLASLDTVALNLVAAPLASLMRSEDTSPTVLTICAAS